MRRRVAITLTTVTLTTVTLAVAAAGCGNGDSADGAPTSAVPTADTTAVPVDRPAPVDAATRTERAGRLPAGSLTTDWAELVAAYGRDEDWHGALGGQAFFEFRTGTWRLCVEILESYPVQCGASVLLEREPAIYQAQPELFEVQRSERTTMTDEEPGGDPVVAVSVGLVTIEGTFFHDSVVFRPDA